MKKLILLIILITSLIFSQTVTWRKEIPFESADDGPVGFDVDTDGNIYVACYSNGPNSSQWIEDTDSLIHSPNTKVINLDMDGNILQNKNLGIIFNHQVSGIGLNTEGYNLQGINSKAYFDVLYEEYYSMRDAWFINYSGSESIDTLIFNSDEQIEYDILKTKSSYNQKSVSKLYRIDTYAGGGSSGRLIDMYGKCLFDVDSIIIPDSLKYIKKDLKSFGHGSIYDFDVVNNDVVTCGHLLNSTYGGFTYLIKSSDSHTKWEIYKEVGEFGDFSFTFIKAVLDNNGECIVNAWIDQDQDHQEDEYEYFIQKYSDTGELEYTSSAMREYLSFLYNIAPGEYIAQTRDEITIFKFTDNGSDINIDWQHPFDNIDIVRPVLGGFITAGTDDSNIIIQKIDTTTGIQQTENLPLGTKLYQNYPNPFNLVTEINFSLNQKQNINLSVFNSNGELVQTLFDGKKNKGMHSVKFDTSRFNSGVYFYKLSTDESIKTRKMLFLK
ncbi:MAG: T9SS type A sorting domain-containing protein [Candidatus Delongbacteria bacterium]|nr:T9SS type A sorting domain-containing protein [Candidatus Delongbacteria bacterium]